MWHMHTPNFKLDWTDIFRTTILFPESLGVNSYSFFPPIYFYLILAIGI